ncbi:MAG: copper resistance protein CopC [Candidatus Nanopelagicales bacterium]
MTRTPASRRRRGPARPVLATATALLVALLAALAGLAAAPAAQAHADLVSTDPADGSALDSPPTEVTLTFSEDVLDAGTQLVAEGPDGTRMPLPSAVTGPDVTAAWPADAAGGDWRVDWRVVADDGHTLTGTLRFSYPGTATPSAGSTASPEPSLLVETRESAPSESAAASPQGGPSSVAASPVAAQEDAGSGGSATIILIGVAALLAVAAGVLWVVARRSG